MTADQWHRDILCFRCGGVAVSLLVDEGARGPLLTMEGFIARKSSFLSHAAADGIATAEDGVELLRWLPPSFHGFFCRECDASYCRTCWTVAEPAYEDGEYDGRIGACPGGHQSAVDR